MEAEAALELLGIHVPSSRKVACLWHPEEDASMHVYDDGKFYCFSCQRWGDGYDLLAKAQGKPLRQVIKEQGGNITAGPELTARKVREYVAARWTDMIRSFWAAHLELYRLMPTQVHLDAVDRYGEWLDLRREELDGITYDGDPEPLPGGKAEALIARTEQELMTALEQDFDRLILGTAQEENDTIPTGGNNDSESNVR